MVGALSLLASWRPPTGFGIDMVAGRVRGAGGAQQQFISVRQSPQDATGCVEGTPGYPSAREA
jgi:hypothetical protein